MGLEAGKDDRRMNLMMLLEMAAQGMGEREAVVCDGDRFTSGPRH